MFSYADSLNLPDVDDLETPSSFKELLKQVRGEDGSAARVNLGRYDFRNEHDADLSYSPIMYSNNLSPPLSRPISRIISPISQSTTSSFSVESMLSMPPGPSPSEQCDFLVTNEIDKNTPKKGTSKKLKRQLLSPLSPQLSPSSNHKKLHSKVKGRCRWTDDETKILIEIYKIWNQKLRHNKRVSTWELIKRQYDLRCKQEKVTSNKNIKQIQTRIDYLVNTYKKIKDNNRSTGRGKISFQWYDEMSSILDKRSAIVPVNVSEVIPHKERKTQNSSCTVTSANVQRSVVEPTQTETTRVDEPMNSPMNSPSHPLESDVESENSCSENPAPKSPVSAPVKRMSKQAAFAELVGTLQSEMAKQTKEVELQNRHFREAAEADRLILQELVQSYKADSEANAKMISILSELVKKD